MNSSWSGCHVSCKINMASQAALTAQPLPRMKLEVSAEGAENWWKVFFHQLYGYHHALKLKTEQERKSTTMSMEPSNWATFQRSSHTFVVSNSRLSCTAQTPNSGQYQGQSLAQKRRCQKRKEGSSPHSELGRPCFWSMHAGVKCSLGQHNYCWLSSFSSWCDFQHLFMTPESLTESFLLLQNLAIK